MVQLRMQEGEPTPEETPTEEAPKEEGVETPEV